ncbi:hypothetical protein ACH4D5_11435 [Streptomyces sp. NPDC018029]|uniref:hypothetical protein n=1 Tax=Streptomyces sp. NPDC018029 TaxID=3365032 RepID=UPI0037B78EFE
MSRTQRQEGVRAFSDSAAGSDSAVGSGSAARSGGALSGDDGDSGWDARGKPPRRATADPVKALLHHHRELCERAVDPLEIAAGLEAHGITDRAAARFRHRDVFALAEEMYARVPHADAGGATTGGATTGGVTSRGTDTDTGTGSGPRRLPEVPPGWALFALLPGTVCAAAVVALGIGEGSARFVIAPLGALAVGVALRIALRYGPLRAVGRQPRATRAWMCWLLAYALLGDGLLAGVVAGGQGGPGGPGGPGDLWDPAVAALLGLALAVAPAIWCARLFAVRAAGRLAASRGLDEFAASVRPLLCGVFALFLGALVALLALAYALLGEAEGGAGAGLSAGLSSGLSADLSAGPDGGAVTLVGAAALGALLLLARLLGVYGFRRAPALLLGAAGASEAAALALVFAGRLPGCDALAVPVAGAVDAWGPGVVPAVACGGAALVLLVHAARTLTLASAHAGARDAP